MNVFWETMSVCSKIPANVFSDCLTNLFSTGIAFSNSWIRIGFVIVSHIQVATISSCSGRQALICRGSSGSAQHCCSVFIPFPSSRPLCDLTNEYYFEKRHSTNLYIEPTYPSIFAVSFSSPLVSIHFALVELLLYERYSREYIHSNWTWFLQSNFIIIDVLDSIFHTYLSCSTHTESDWNWIDCLFVYR